VCQALIFAELDIPEDACFMVHQYGVAMAILSAALRMVRVDHVDTQTILFKLNQTIAEDYAMAATRKLEDMANFAPVVDLLAAIHVKAHVRLFMN
jgi:urease accessory protein